jgi:hypothetical protein
LLKKIIDTNLKEKTANDLKILLVDGMANTFKYTNKDQYFLTKIITNNDKLSSSLKWLCIEIEKRQKFSSTELKKQPNILLVINSFNALNYSLYGEIEEALSRIFQFGKSAKVYCAVGFDLIDQKFRKDLFAHVGAKLVFKQATSALARSSGVPESLKLKKPNEAILETMWDGKKKIILNKLQP